MKILHVTRFNGPNIGNLRYGKCIITALKTSPKQLYLRTNLGPIYKMLGKNKQYINIKKDQKPIQVSTHFFNSKFEKVKTKQLINYP